MTSIIVRDDIDKSAIGYIGLTEDVIEQNPVVNYQNNIQDVVVTELDYYGVVRASGEANSLYTGYGHEIYISTQEVQRIMNELGETFPREHIDSTFGNTVIVGEESATYPLDYDALWLASDLADTGADEQFVNWPGRGPMGLTDWLIDFDTDGQAPILRQTNGKWRVECPKARHVNGITAGYPIEHTFSLVLVYSSIANGDGGLILKLPDVDGGIQPSLTPPNYLYSESEGLYFSDNPVPGTDIHVIIFTQYEDLENGSGLRYYVDGVDDTNDSTSDEWGVLEIGTSFGNYINSNIMAIGVYKRVLTAQEIEDVTNWGLSL